MIRSLAFVFLLACGHAKPGVSTTFAPYDDDRLFLIGSQANAQSGVVVSDPHASCVMGGTCFAPAVDSAFCPVVAAPADIGIIAGVLRHTFCYPAASKVTITASTKGDVLVSEPGAVVIFDESTIGVPFTGKLDISVDGVTIWGNGPPATIFDGDLVVAGKNVAVRGVHIGGEVSTTEPFALILSTISGDVTLPPASALLQSAIFGSLITSQSFIIGNEVQGTFTVATSDCDGNKAFFDADGNGLVSDTEVGAPVVCK